MDTSWRRFLSSRFLKTPEMMVFQKMFITNLLHSVLSLLNLIQAQQWITDLSSTMTQPQPPQDFKSRADWWQHTPMLMPLPLGFGRYLLRLSWALHWSQEEPVTSLPPSLGAQYVPSAAPLLFWLKPIPFSRILANIFHWSETLFIQLMELTVHLLCSCRHSKSIVIVTGVGCLAWHNHSRHMW